MAVDVVEAAIGIDRDSGKRRPVWRSHSPSQYGLRIQPKFHWNAHLCTLEEQIPSVLHFCTGRKARLGPHHISGTIRVLVEPELAVMISKHSTVVQPNQSPGDRRTRACVDDL